MPTCAILMLNPGYSRREPSCYNPRTLRSTTSFAAVSELGSSLKPNILAEIEVTRLYGDFRQPQSPIAVLTMRFLFFDAPKASPEKSCWNGSMRGLFR